MRKLLILVGLLLLTASFMLAQDFPKVETSPAFMFIHTPIDIQGNNRALNCVGGGGTLAYNVTSVVGLAADLGGCKYVGQTFPNLDSRIDGNAFTFLFGPRFTYRSKSAFQPFGEVNFGGARLSLTCNSNGENCLGNPTFSKTAFAMTAGGGFDIKINKKFSIRPVQAEYLLTRFGNDCSTVGGTQYCNNFGNQNSFRLKSGIVINWGGSSN